MRIALFVFLPLFLLARENPFLPSPEYHMETAPNQLKTDVESFEQHSQSLPSSARILEYVVFGYQSLDGDTKELRFDINKRIDWHDDMVVTTQSYMGQIAVPQAPPPNPQPTEETQVVAEEVVAVEVAPQPKEDTKVVEFVHEKIEETRVQEVELLNYISFEIGKNSIIVKTEDDLLRNFMMVQPYKIVLDFKRDTAFYTKKLHIDYGSFNSITMGNHNGYYRAVILLDGYYRYSMKKVDGGYLVELR